MSAPTYLIKNRYGIYSYRFITPTAVRRLFPQFKHEVRLTTRSRSVRQASRIAAYFHHHYQTFFEKLQRQGRIMDDWLDDSPAEQTRGHWLSPVLETDEHIQSITHSRVLMSLLQRGKEIDNLLSIYSDVFEETIALEDFKLNTAQDIEVFMSVAHIFATEDVCDPKPYLKKLKVKSVRQRRRKVDDIQKSVHVGQMSRLKPNVLPMEAVNSSSQFKALKSFSREQLANIIVQVAQDHSHGRPSSFIIERGHDQIVLEDVSIDSEDDLTSLMTMLEMQTDNGSDRAAESKVTKPKHETKFSEFAKLFLKQRFRNLARSQNRAHAQSAVDLFLEYYHEDPLVHEVSREMAEQLLSVLLCLPPNRKIRNDTKNLTLKEILAENWDTTLGEQGAAKYLTEWRQFYEYAIQMKYAVNNPFLDLSPLKKKRDKRKEAANKSGRRFKQSELNSIFSATDFTKRASRSYHFWVPLLCLYTGARVNEIAQLDVDDIYKHNNVWCIDINTNMPDKTVKNEPSKRLVPIHNTLIELGFLRYVAAIRDASADKETAVYRTRKLWWDIYTVSGSYSNACSKSLSSIFKKAGVVRDGDKFHGLRHSLTHCLKEAGVDESTYGALLGHDISMRTSGLYGSAPSVQLLKKALDKVEPLPQEVLNAIKPYGLPKTLLPKKDWKRFDRKKYLVDFSREITEKKLWDKINSWTSN